MPLRRTARARNLDADPRCGHHRRPVKFVPQTVVEQIRKATKPPCRVILHTGGLETVAQEIERILAH